MHVRLLLKKCCTLIAYRDGINELILWYYRSHGRRLNSTGRPGNGLR